MVFVVHPHEIGTFNLTYEAELMLSLKKKQKTIRHVNPQFHACYISKQS